MQIVQAHFGSIGERKSYINQNERFAKNNNLNYMFVSQWPEQFEKPKTTDAVVLSEYLRFYLASQIDDMVWIDTDAALIEIPDIECGYPYFHTTRINTIDYALFFVNERKDFFESLVIEHSKRNILPVYMGWSKVLRDKESLVKFISDQCFIHDQITFKKWESERIKNSIEKKQRKRMRLSILE